MRPPISAGVSRRISLTIAVIAFPLVWAVGYQDHPWRRPLLAMVIGLLLTLSAAALHLEGSESPEVPTWRTTIALAIAVASLSAAVFWWWIDRS